MRTLPLLPMEAAFAVQYARNGGNGRQAAIAAGYSARSAAVLAHRLKNRPAVLAEIDRQKARQLRAQVAERARRRLQEMTP